MLDTMLNDLAERIVGKAGAVIIEILKDKRDVNEFKIAEKLKLTINQVRNLLYKLDAQDVVSFIRKKDKRKGWYIYYWSLDNLKALKLLARIKDREIQQFNHLLLSQENKRFFMCKGCEIELTEENALAHNFACAECGSLLDLSNNNEKILEIKKSIAREKKQLDLMHNEIAKLSEEESKKAAKKSAAASKSIKKKKKAGKNKAEKNSGKKSKKKAKKAKKNKK
ncbi:MAG: hypothetical protein V1886_00390 [archaeon]